MRLFIALLLLTLAHPALAAPAPLKLLFLGDSITAEGARDVTGFVNLIQNRYGSEIAKSIETKAIAHPGYRVTHLETHLQEALAWKPKVAFIYIGINDVWHHDQGVGTTPELYEKTLTNLARALKKAGAKVALATPTIIGEDLSPANPYNARLDQFAEIARGVARKTGAVSCDLRRAFQDRLRADNRSNAPQGTLTRDGVHLNAAGNELVATTAADCLAKITRKSSGQAASPR